jgi:hypothetical protein
MRDLEKRESRKLGRDFIFHPFVIGRHVMGLIRNEEDSGGRDCYKYVRQDI